MITGSIKTHKEPEKFNHNYTGWGNNFYEEMYDGYLSNHDWKEKENRLFACVNAATIRGLVVGARVKRASGTPGFGTIIHIHRTYTMALNTKDGTLEPLKVTWDKTNPHNGGTFDYNPDALVLAKELPAIFKQDKGINYHEQA